MAEDIGGGIVIVGGIPYPDSSSGPDIQDEIYDYVQHRCISELPTNVETFDVTTFIPYAFVEDPMGVLFKGDGAPNDLSSTRSSYRTKQRLSFTARGIANGKILSHFQDVGPTERFVDQWFVGAGESVRYNNKICFKDAELRADKESQSSYSIGATNLHLTRSGGSCCCTGTVAITMHGHGGNPLGASLVGFMSLTPKITYTMTLEYSRRTCSEPWRLSAKGSHDGFPSYVFSRGGTAFHTHNAWGHSPLELFGLWGGGTFEEHF